MYRLIQFRKKIFLVWLTLLALGAFAGCDSTFNLTDVEHVANAKDFLDKGDVNGSIIELKNALQKNAKNPEARRLLGLNYLRKENGPAAEKELRRAIDLGVAMEAIALPLAEALKLQGKNQQIVDEIEVLNGLDVSDQAKLIAFRGDAWLGLDKQENARAEFERALQIDSSSAPAKLGLARLAGANGEIDTALGLIAEVLETSPDNPRAWSLQANLYEIQGENRKAEESYGKAIQFRPLSHLDRAKRAIVRMKLKDVEASEDDVAALEKHAPSFFLTHYTKGLLNFQKNKFPEAQTAFEEAVKLNSRYIQTYYFLGVANLFQKNLAQADNHLSRYVNAVPDSMEARTFLALARYQTKDLDDARRTLLPLFTEGLPNNGIPIRLMANIEMALGNSDQGLYYLQKLIELNPESAVSHATLGVAQLLSKDNLSGIPELEAALELDPNLQRAEELIAFSHLKAKEFDQAKAVIDRILEKQPESPTAFNLLGLFYAAQSNRDNAVKAFEHAVQLDPGTLSASVNLARHYSREKQYGKARKLYEQILEKHPEQLLPKLLLAKIDGREGLLNVMEQRLTRVIENYPDALQPRLMLGEYYLRFGQPSRTQTLLEKVKLRHPTDPRLLYLLADAQLADNRPKRALATAKTLSAAQPNSARAQFMLSKAYAANRDVDKMRAALERSLEIDPKFLRSRFARVKQLTLEGKTGDAEQLLNALSREYPNLYENFTLQGWFALRTGHPEKAAIAYKTALERSPTTRNVINLAKAQWRADQKEQSVDTLETWIKDHPKDGMAYFMSASLHTKLGEKTEAEAKLKELLKISPDNILALNELAWLIRQDNPQQAREYAEKAAKLSPNSVVVTDTLAMVLIENQKYRRALRLLQRAVGKAPKSLLLQYHLAIAQNKNGDTSAAIQTLESILENRQTFDERRDAEALLKQLRSG